MKKLTPDEQIRISNIPAFKGSWWKDSHFIRNILGWFNILPKMPHLEIKQLKDEKYRPTCLCGNMELRWNNNYTQDIGDAIHHERCRYLQWVCDRCGSGDEHEHEYLERNKNLIKEK